MMVPFPKMKNVGRKAVEVKEHNGFWFSNVILILMSHSIGHILQALNFRNLMFRGKFRDTGVLIEILMKQ